MNKIEKLPKEEELKYSKIETPTSKDSVSKNTPGENILKDFLCNSEIFSKASTKLTSILSGSMDENNQKIGPIEKMEKKQLLKEDFVLLKDEYLKNNFKNQESQISGISNLEILNKLTIFKEQSEDNDSNIETFNKLNNIKCFGTRNEDKKKKIEEEDEEIDDEFEENDEDSENEQKKIFFYKFNFEDANKKKELKNESEDKEEGSNSDNNSNGFSDFSEDENEKEENESFSQEKEEEIKNLIQGIKRRGEGIFLDNEIKEKNDKKDEIIQEEKKTDKKEIIKKDKSKEQVKEKEKEVKKIKEKNQKKNEKEKKEIIKINVKEDKEEEQSQNLKEIKMENTINFSKENENLEKTKKEESKKNLSNTEEKKEDSNDDSFLEEENKSFFKKGWESFSFLGDNNTSLMEANPPEISQISQNLTTQPQISTNPSRLNQTQNFLSMNQPIYYTNIQKRNITYPYSNSQYQNIMNYNNNYNLPFHNFQNSSNQLLYNSQMMNFFINNNNNFGQMIPVVSNNHIYYNINNSLSYINNANMNFSNQLNNNNNNYCNKNSINPKQKLNIKMECHSKMYSNKLNSTPNPTSVLCLHRLEDKQKIIQNQNQINITTTEGHKEKDQTNSNESNNSNDTDICSPKVNSKKKEIDKRFQIDLLRIKLDLETRTTIRMMNIPSYFKAIDLSQKIDLKFGIEKEKENRVYNFIYVPLLRENNNQNLGFAFINFMNPKHIIKFLNFFQGKKLKSKHSNKSCLITFAEKQESSFNFNKYNNNKDKFLYFTDTKNHWQLLN